MADVILRIINEGVTEATQGVSDVAKAYNNVSKEANEANKDTTKLYKDSAKGAEQFNKIILDAKPAVEIKKQRSELQKLKDEIKQYTNAAIKAGEGTKEFARNLAEAGKRKADLKDLQQAIAALDPDVKAKAFLQLGQTMSNGIAAGIGALQAFGLAGEDAQKTLVKLQAAMAFGQFIGGLGELGDTFKILQVQIRNSEIAQKAFNIVSSANPYILIGTAIAGVTAAFLASADAVNGDTTAFINNNEAVKEAREQRKNLQSDIENLIIDLQVESGQLTKQQGENLKGFKAYQREYEKIQNDRTKAIEKALEEEQTITRSILLTGEEEARRDAEIKAKINAEFDKLSEDAIKKQGLVEKLARQKEANEKAAEDKKKADEEQKRREEDFKQKQKQREEAEQKELDIQAKVTDARIKIAQDETKKTEDEIQKKFEKLKKESEDRLAFLLKTNDEILSLQDEFVKTDLQKQLDHFDQRKAEADRIHKQGLLSEEDYQQLIQGIQRESHEAQIKAAQTLNQQRLQVGQQLINGLGALASLAAQQGADVAEFQKALAIAQIAIDTAKSISAGIAGATTSATATGPGAFVATPIFIATTVATILGAIAQAAAVVNSTNIPRPNFWTGGYTGDGGKYDFAGNVHKGEYVINKEKTSKHRSILDAIQYDKQITPLDLSSLLHGTGVTMAQDFKEKTINAFDNKQKSEITKNSESDKRLANIEAELKRWRAESKNKPQSSINGDVEITKNGNVTRKIRRKRL